MTDYIQRVQSKIDDKQNVITCYKQFLEMAALKCEAENERYDELLSEFNAITNKNSKMKDKGKLCEEDIRHEEEVKKRTTSSYDILTCYRGILEVLQESLDKCLSGK